MPISAYLPRLFQSDADSPSAPFLVTTTVATTLAALYLFRYTTKLPARKLILSPRSTRLPKLSQEQKDSLAYPPDVFPGARDVSSPYGTIRVFEWGPETGKKVLLIHGISTPCLALGGVASGLVARGCRVLIFDLFGRGYSDSVDLPHDSRLYTTQILLALTSSPLAWTPDGFSVVGYSLGGGIAVDFAASTNGLVKELCVLAPSGLLRKEHLGWQARLLYTGILPDRLLQFLVKKRLQSGPVSGKKNDKKVASAESAVSEELTGTDKKEGDGDAPYTKVAAAVKWQINNHEGFVNSFVSSVRYASIQGRNDAWTQLGKKDGKKVFVMVGKNDTLILPNELIADASAAIGKEKAEFKIMEGGHDFPITNAADVVEEIVRFWSL